MQLFLLNVKLYDYDNNDLNTDNISAIYSSFEKAKKGGISELKRKFVEAEGTLEVHFTKLLESKKIGYDFTITVIDDLEYAENFNVNYDLFSSDKYLELEPTHKIYDLDYKGNVNFIKYEYRIKNLVWRCSKSVKILPEDFDKISSNKLKIEDVINKKNI